MTKQQVDQNWDAMDASDAIIHRGQHGMTLMGQGESTLSERGNRLGIYLGMTAQSGNVPRGP